MNRDDLIFEFQRLSLVATTRNAILFLLSRHRDKEAAEPNQAHDQKDRSKKAKNAEAGDSNLPKCGLATIISLQPEIALCHDARLQRATNAPR